MTAKHTPLPELAAKFNGRVQCGPDMWILRDCPLGVNMITLGVPHGDKLTAPAVAHRFNAYPDLKEKLAQLEHQTTEQGRMLGAVNRENDRLTERVAELEEALQPFAHIGSVMSDEDGWSDTDVLELTLDDTGAAPFASATAGDFRRAALAKAKGGAR